MTNLPGSVSVTRATLGGGQANSLLLKDNYDISIVFSGVNKGELIGFADTDWVGEISTRRSMTIYLFFLNDGTISCNFNR